MLELCCKRNVSNVHAADAGDGDGRSASADSDGLDDAYALDGESDDLELEEEAPDDDDDPDDAPDDDDSAPERGREGKS
jgi:hypothetical protein